MKEAVQKPNKTVMCSCGRVRPLMPKTTAWRCVCGKINEGQQSKMTFGSPSTEVAG